MEIKNPHQIEYETITNPIFLGIMLFGCTIIPITLIILKATILSNLWIILIVFGIIVLPSGILFTGNGIRLLYGHQMCNWVKNGIKKIIQGN